MTKPGIIPGPGGRRPSPANSQAHYAALTKIMQGKGDEVKVRKVRGADKGVRHREEDIFRKDLIGYLRNNGCKVWRVEPSFRGKFGLGDLWVFCFRTKWGGWVECKSVAGRLSADQKEFQMWCRICGVKYVVAKYLDDVMEVLA